MSGRAPGPAGPFGLLLRIGLLVVLVIVGTWGAHLLKDALDLTIMPSNEQQVHRTLMLGALVYVGLLAIPFVPGAEIGIAMLTAFGAGIAPMVYAATVLAMMLAYLIGRGLSPRTLAGLLRLMRLRRAADLVDRAAALPPEARLALLLDGSPPRTVGRALRHRYIALALIVNTPGNAVIGGGGGIMMMAGMSGVFSPLPTLLTIALAVSPVPLAVMIFGA